MLFRSPGGNLVRVGDPNQAIMSSFTSSSPGLFSAFCSQVGSVGLLLGGTAYGFRAYLNTVKITERKLDELQNVNVILFALTGPERNGQADVSTEFSDLSRHAESAKTFSGAYRIVLMQNVEAGLDPDNGYQEDKLLTQFEDDNFVYILMELCSNQTLVEMLRQRKRLTETEVRYFLIQILLTVQYLHNQGVIHRDLKLGNLFLNDKMRIKLVLPLPLAPAMCSKSRGASVNDTSRNSVCSPRTQVSCLTSSIVGSLSYARSAGICLSER